MSTVPTAVATVIADLVGRMSEILSRSRSMPVVRWPLVTTNRGSVTWTWSRCSDTNAALTGYWTVAIGWRWVWWKDSFVDLGLVTLPRACAALTDGRLITKGEGIEQLSDFRVPAELVEQSQQRRAGQRTRSGVRARARRARLARILVAAGIDELVT